MVRRRDNRERSSVAGFFRGWDAELGGMQKDLKEEAKRIRQDRKAMENKTAAATPSQSPRSSPSESEKPEKRMTSSVPCSQAGANAYLRAWHVHDADYRKFQERANDAPPLLFDDIPWPPCSADVLEFLEKLWSPGHPRQAYRIACRRWHPDKFLQLYGPKVHDDDRERVTLKLNDIFQTVSNEWTKKEKIRAL